MTNIGPQTRQDRVKEEKRKYKMVPRRPKREPRWIQEGQKGVPDGPKAPQKWTIRRPRVHMLAKREVPDLEKGGFYVEGVVNFRILIDFPVDLHLSRRIFIDLP